MAVTIKNGVPEENAEGNV